MKFELIAFALVTNELKLTPAGICKLDMQVLDSDHLPNCVQAASLLNQLATNVILPTHDESIAYPRVYTVYT